MDQKTIDTYNQLAKEYDQETAIFWETFPNILKDFLDKFSDFGKGKLLNIGSGPGRDGLLLQEYGFDVTCLDASDAMVALSSARGLDSILGDFENLPFPNDNFDAVWAYTSLLHVPKNEVRKPLAEIHRVLKPYGVFALGMIEGDTELYRNSSDVRQARWFSFYRKPGLEAILTRAGFDLIYFQEFTAGKTNLKNYLNYILRKI